MSSKRSTIRATLWPCLKRYAPLEVAGALGTLAGGWLGFIVFDRMGVAVLAATMGECLGYYGLALMRELRQQRWPGHSRPWGSNPANVSGYGALRALLLEFGPAELLDTVWIRPGAMLLVSRSMDHLALSLLIGKLLADLVFYTLAVAGRELARRQQGAVSLQEVQPS